MIGTVGASSLSCVAQKDAADRSPPTLTETVTDHMRGVVKPSGP